MKLFFIVGTGRCGTQMMRSILECWPNVKVLPETHFVIPLFDKYGLDNIGTDEFLNVINGVHGSDGEIWINVIINKTGYQGSDFLNDFKEYINKKNIGGNIRDYIQAFYRFLYGDNLVIGDKSPHYGTNLDIIKKIWPDALVIHLVRDGIDVAHSMRDHPGFRRFINQNVSPKNLDRITYTDDFSQYPSDKPSMESAIKFWGDLIDEITRNLKKLNEDDYIEIKYEDLNLYPRKTIGKISSFLGLNSGRAFQEAVRIPRPFPEKRQIKKLTNEEYQRFYPLIAQQMKRYNYPYDLKINRSLTDSFKEMYRGRKYYSYSILKRIKSFFPETMKDKIKNTIWFGR